MLRFDLFAAYLATLGQFKDLSTEVVIMPAQYKSGDVIYPYEMAK